MTRRKATRNGRKPGCRRLHTQASMALMHHPAASPATCCRMRPTMPRMRWRGLSAAQRRSGRRATRCWPRSAGISRASSTHVRDDFETYRMAGVEAAQRLSALTDGVVRVLFDHAVQRMAGPGGLRGPTRAIAATGGYGRSMLAPFSDIDLLFLRPTSRAGHAARRRIHAVFHVGPRPESGPCHAHHRAMPGRRERGPHDPHQPAGCTAADRRCRSVRCLPSPQFAAASEAAGLASFVAGKQAERRPGIGAFGESAFLVEPNIKEGRGGLRDLQTQYWMVRAAFGPVTPNELVEGSLGLLEPQELRRLRRSLGLPVDRALPHALRRRPCGGPADVRPAARGRRAHGIHAARRAGWRGTFHAPLFPDRARRDAADAWCWSRWWCATRWASRRCRWKPIVRCWKRDLCWPTGRSCRGAARFRRPSRSGCCAC